MKPQFATLILVAVAWPGFGQSGEAILTPGKVHSAAISNLVAGFNALGGRASDLRHAMTLENAESFNAVMQDLMSALIALPGVAIATAHDPSDIVPQEARPDRVPQLAADLAGLERLFGRLSGSSAAPASRKMFRQA